MGNEIIVGSKQYFDHALADIDRLVNEEGLVDEAYKKYVELVKEIESEHYTVSSELKSKTYASFAYFLFGVYEYEQFYRMLIKAQEHGYSREEIEKILWEAFVQPNLNEFKSMYEANLRLLRLNGCIEFDHLLSFQELPFWLLPTGVTDEYYIYDKEQRLIIEKILLFERRSLEQIPISDAFADYLLMDNWNWNHVLPYINRIKRSNKKCYVVLNNIGQFLSCLQGALLSEDSIKNVFIFHNISALSNYLKSNDVFLPRNIINLVQPNDVLQQMIDDIHNYRIGKKERNGNEILLSICIPSYNRGKRAYENITRLLTSCYDEEIEIVLSNNGTKNETEEFYEKIKNIKDSRLTYYAFEENQGFPLNCCKVCELAKGRFILLLSDEDVVNFNVLDKVLNILNNSKESLAMLRTSTLFQSKPSVKIASPGKDALQTFMLTSNYISGIILNNSLLKQHEGIEYIAGNLNNSACSLYPHMVWELLLCQYGKVQGTDLILVHEGSAEETNFATTKMGNGDVEAPYYTTLEGRLEQHQGFTTVFKDLEICRKNPDFLREMYIRLCAKTLFLINLSINDTYSRIEEDALQLLDKGFNYCTNKEFYKDNISNSRNNYRNDLKIISQYYERSKGGLLKQANR